MSNFKKGYFGQFGGQFVSELLYPALKELEEVFEQSKKNIKFKKELHQYLASFAGRPTPLQFVQRISEEVGFKVYFKREDLLHGGSHKLNNALGQVLLAKEMGKKKIITETGAGMHGVATVLAANVVGLKTEVYMGVKDIKRQRMNAEKIKLLGGLVRPVTRGHGVLKDAVSEALVAWITNLKDIHYLIGTTIGPHPFPVIAAYFQSIIGKEMRRQILKIEGKLPKAVIACGSGGSNSLGSFLAFQNDKKVELVFVEGGGSSLKGGQHAAAFTDGSVGVFQGTKTYLTQDEYGMDRKTESRAAGLNYPARGPQLAYLYSIGRIKATYATDKEVMKIYQKVAQLSGVLPAFETCHALVELFKRKGKYKRNDVVIVTFSGRGDKDLETALKFMKERIKV